MRFLVLLVLATLPPLGVQAFEMEETVPELIARVTEEAAQERAEVIEAAYSVCMFAKDRTCIEDFGELNLIFDEVKKNLFRAAVIHNWNHRLALVFRAEEDRKEAMQQYRALRKKYRSKSASAFFGFP